MNIPIPEGCELMPFQKEGIEWAISKMRGEAHIPSKSVLIGDSMGLGKTIQAIGILNCIQWSSALIICPASVRINWQREASKWLISKPEIGVVESGKIMPSGDLIICNYELAGKHEDIKGRHWDIIVCDESHYLKSSKAQRTKNVMALRSNHFVFLTGTPILNRPAELWTIAHKCAPKAFPSWWGYAKRYCDMKETRFGMDVKGASNLSELNQKLTSTFMIRRRKEDVLRDLPALRRQIIELPPTKEMRIVLDRENMQWKVHEETMAKLVARRDNAAMLNDETEYRGAARELKQAFSVAFAEMAKVRQEVALAKLPLCISHIKDTLESVDKVLVFCRHKAVAANLMTELSEHNPVVLMGDTSMKERQKSIDSFVQNPSVRVFVGSIQAAGTGVNGLQFSCCHAIFVEPDWTPAIISQAEGRLHRHGQKMPVLVQHLVLESSLDSHMLKQVMAKQEIIDQAIDAAGGNKEEAKKKLKVSYADDGAKFTPTQRALLIKCLKVVAEKDKDGARQKNGEGFSIYHSQLGKQLAQKWELTNAEAGFAAMLVKRYRKQIDAGMVKLAGVEL